MSTKKNDNKVEETITEEAKLAQEAEDKRVAEEKAKAEKKAEETKVELTVLIAFTDKYTNESYEVDAVITVDKVRAEELLADTRKLVKK